MRSAPAQTAGGQRCSPPMKSGRGQNQIRSRLITSLGGDSLCRISHTRPLNAKLTDHPGDCPPKPMPLKRRAKTLRDTRHIAASQSCRPDASECSTTAQAHSFGQGTRALNHGRFASFPTSGWDVAISTSSGRSGLRRVPSMVRYSLVDRGGGIQPCLPLR